MKYIQSNSKNTKTTLLMSCRSGVFIVKFEYISLFLVFFFFFFADFEQVNVSCEGYQTYDILLYGARINFKLKKMCRLVENNQR